MRNDRLRRGANLLKAERRSRLAELAALFLRLGATAFGGPAAHIAMLRDEAVTRREWLTDEEFLDLMGATNLIPGPNSTEMALHIGYLRAGLAGLVVAGACFILPAMGIVTALAWAYVAGGNLPQVGGMLYGVKPVVLAVVAMALWGLGKTAVKSGWALAGAAGIVALNLLGWNEILLLGIGAVVALAAANGPRWLPRLSAGIAGLASNWGPGSREVWIQATGVDGGTLFLVFFKIGSVLYGSGYVLLAFMRADFVTRLGWLTDTQLLDAVAVGQVTPGPVFTTATFVGYVLAGLPGALVATVGIFLPSFVFVAVTAKILPRLLRIGWLKSALNGVNIASLALMATVSLYLGLAALVDIPTTAVFAISLALLVWKKANTTWLILGGLLFGLLAGV